MNVDEQILAAVQPEFDKYRSENKDAISRAIEKISAIAGKSVSAYCNGVCSQSQVVMQLSIAGLLVAATSKQAETLDKFASVAKGLCCDYNETLSLTTLAYLAGKIEDPLAAKVVHDILGEALMSADKRLRNLVSKVLAVTSAIREGKGA